MADGFNSEDIPRPGRKWADVATAIVSILTSVLMQLLLIATFA